MNMGANPTSQKRRLQLVRRTRTNQRNINACVARLPNAQYHVRYAYKPAERPHNRCQYRSCWRRPRMESQQAGLNVAACDTGATSVMAGAPSCADAAPADAHTQAQQRLCLRASRTACGTFAVTYGAAATRRQRPASRRPVVAAMRRLPSPVVLKAGRCVQVVVGRRDPAGGRVGEAASQRPQERNQTSRNKGGRGKGGGAECLPIQVV